MGGESAPAVRHDRVSLNTHVARPCVPVSVLLDVVQRDLDDFAVCGSVKVGAERPAHDHGFPELVILRQSVTRYLGLNLPGVLDFEAEVYVTEAGHEPSGLASGGAGESVSNLFPACAFLRAVVATFLEKPFHRLLDFVFAPP